MMLVITRNNNELIPPKKTRSLMLLVLDHDKMLGFEKSFNSRIRRSVFGI